MIAVGITLVALIGWVGWALEYQHHKRTRVIATENLTKHMQNIIDMIDKWESEHPAK